MSAPRLVIAIGLRRQSTRAGHAMTGPENLGIVVRMRVSAQSPFYTAHTVATVALAKAAA